MIEYDKLVLKTAEKAAVEYNRCMMSNIHLATTLDQRIKLMEKCKENAAYNPKDLLRPSKSWGMLKWLAVAGIAGGLGWVAIKGYRGYKARKAGESVGKRSYGQLAPDGDYDAGI